MAQDAKVATQGTQISASSALGLAGERDEDAICWICLESSSDLIYPCKCPRAVHARCLARWQLQSAGTSRETTCDFCKCALPDWKSVLTPERRGPRAAPAVMNVNYGGRTYSFEVRSGPDGYAAFTRAIRRAFGLPGDSELNITFTCDEPTTRDAGSLLTLQGAGAYDAAVHCASISAARRAVSTAPPAATRAGGGATGGRGDGAGAGAGAGDQARGRPPHSSSSSSGRLASPATALGPSRSQAPPTPAALPSQSAPAPSPTQGVMDALAGLSGVGGMRYSPSSPATSTQSSLASLPLGRNLLGPDLASWVGRPIVGDGRSSASGPAPWGAASPFPLPQRASPSPAPRSSPSSAPSRASPSPSRASGGNASEFASAVSEPGLNLDDESSFGGGEDRDEGMEVQGEAVQGGGGSAALPVRSAFRRYRSSPRSVDMVSAQSSLTDAFGGDSRSRGSAVLPGSGWMRPTRAGASLAAAMGEAREAAGRLFRAASLPLGGDRSAGVRDSVEGAAARGASGVAEDAPVPGVAAGQGPAGAPRPEPSPRRRPRRRTEGQEPFPLFGEDLALFERRSIGGGRTAFARPPASPLEAALGRSLGDAPSNGDSRPNARTTAAGAGSGQRTVTRNDLSLDPSSSLASPSPSAAALASSSAAPSAAPTSGSTPMPASASIPVPVPATTLAPSPAPASASPPSAESVRPRPPPAPTGEGAGEGEGALPSRDSWQEAEALLQTPTRFITLREAFPAGSAERASGDGREEPARTSEDSVGCWDFGRALAPRALFSSDADLFDVTMRDGDDANEQGAIGNTSSNNNSNGNGNGNGAVRSERRQGLDQGPSTPASMSPASLLAAAPTTPVPLPPPAATSSPFSGALFVPPTPSSTSPVPSNDAREPGRLAAAAAHPSASPAIGPVSAAARRAAPRPLRRRSADGSAAGEERARARSLSSLRGLSPPRSPRSGPSGSSASRGRGRGLPPLRLSSPSSLAESASLSPTADLSDSVYGGGEGRESFTSSTDAVSDEAAPRRPVAGESPMAHEAGGRLSVFRRRLRAVFAELVS